MLFPSQGIEESCESYTDHLLGRLRGNKGEGLLQHGSKELGANEWQLFIEES